MATDDSLTFVLRDFARTMLTDFPIQRILDQLVERIVNVLPITAAGVTLIEPGMAPRYVAASHDDALRFERLQSELSEGPCLSAFETGEQVLIPDLRLESRFPGYTSAAVAAGLAAVFAFPLRHDGARLGALDVYRDEPGPLSTEAQAAAQTLADVAAAYIINAQARDEAALLAGWFRDQSLHDLLTGLPNRVLLHQRLQHATERSRRTDSVAAVLFLDLDHFKHVNDAYGHDVGDQALIAVARRLAGLVRPGDTIARVSGDEFVILCEDLGNVSDVDDILDRIDDAFTAPFELAGTSLALTASVGIAYSQPGAPLTDDLVIHADAAMYQAKNRGTTRQLLDLSSARQLHDLNRLERDLLAGLSAGDLQLVYQPVVRTADRRVTGVEALLRWTHPTRGHIAAPLVLAVAERGGTMGVLGAWILERSCLEWLNWSARRPGEAFDLSVNISARQLLAPDFAATVSRVLASTGMKPADLVLDVTEDVLIDESIRAQRVLHELKGLGARIALDDFGSGYCSLMTLRRFPLDIVKIDRALVASIVTDRTSSAIVSAVTDLAHTLDLTVIAEGVETDQQREDVARVGCDLAQGFLFARPMSAAALSAELN